MAQIDTEKLKQKVRDSKPGGGSNSNNAKLTKTNKGNGAQKLKQK